MDIYVINVFFLTLNNVNAFVNHVFINSPLNTQFSNVITFSRSDSTTETFHVNKIKSITEIVHVPLVLGLTLHGPKFVSTLCFETQHMGQRVTVCAACSTPCSGATPIHGALRSVIKCCSPVSPVGGRDVSQSAVPLSLL